MQIGTNHFGHFVLTDKLLPSMKALVQTHLLHPLHDTCLSPGIFSPPHDSLTPLVALLQSQ